MSSPAGVASLGPSFTDLVGSTGLLSSLGETAPRACAATTINSSETSWATDAGSVIKDLGDGLMASPLPWPLR
ncbi:MAG: hypothetical protein ACRDYC_05060 [Acidimicrobiales bacterium]